MVFRKVWTYSSNTGPQERGVDRSLAFFGGTERNAIDSMLPNQREIFVPFDSEREQKRHESRNNGSSSNASSAAQRPSLRAIDEKNLIKKV
uniref:Uncharacterized protein n=1 Tax=Romanomermis culicivorax TaxID=13658 RepID=A0A915JZD7_ROMCU